MRKADKQALREALLIKLNLELGCESEKLADLCFKAIKPIVEGIVAEATRPFYEGEGGTKVRVGDTVRFPWGDRSFVGQVESFSGGG